MVVLVLVDYLAGLQEEHNAKVMDNGSLSIRTAAKHYNVPRPTLADRFNGRVEIGVKPWRKSALPSKIEDQIVKQTLEAAEAGFGIS